MKKTVSRQAILPVYLPPNAPEFVRGQGVRLFTQDDRAWLDFICGIAVTGLGHAHPHLVAALQEQAGRLWHLSNMLRIEGQERLAQRLVAASFADRVFFTNSGAEAIECALKLARHYHYYRGKPERYRILSFTGSFHGRTFGAINAGGNPAYREGFGPPIPGFEHLDFGDHEALLAAMGPDIAAVLVEPVQGEGGLRALPLACLRGLRELCNTHGALLIYDEIQCGCGRTGRMFAHEWAQDEALPDIMTLAKGIGGGFPVGACLMTNDVAEGMVPGKHGSTYGGNPLAMAVGNAVWDLLSADGFLEQVQTASAYLQEGLEALMRRHSDAVSGLRGKGLLTGLRLNYDPMPIRAAAMEKGLLIGTAGDQMIRLAPPMIIEPSDTDEALEILDQCLSAYKGN